MKLYIETGDQKAVLDIQIEDVDARVKEGIKLFLKQILTKQSGKLGSFMFISETGHYEDLIKDSRFEEIDNSFLTVTAQAFNSMIEFLDTDEEKKNALLMVETLKKSLVAQKDTIDDIINPDSDQS